MYNVRYMSAFFLKRKLELFYVFWETSVAFYDFSLSFHLWCRKRERVIFGLLMEKPVDRFPLENPFVGMVKGE